MAFALTILLMNNPQVSVDGGYTLFIKQFEKLCDKKDKKLNDNNFFYPIEKEPDQELNVQERHFNDDVFESFRPTIESQFYDYEYVNLQIKISFLLKNIKLFTEDFNTITPGHHKLWVTQNFEFPTENKTYDRDAENG
ncbi:hypothetical protein INT46_001371 [Mucor plumbeus]|uniref:Uncharacterized protein n=1 Tax=Mucor plumbeus TaxID=97098 RepID=A0A8H7UT92_9FUNG|nr:hypothetical protein INT46_001371 [Mucor plumbeus]